MNWWKRYAVVFSHPQLTGVVSFHLSELKANEVCAFSNLMALTKPELREGMYKVIQTDKKIRKLSTIG